MEAARMRSKHKSESESGSESQGDSKGREANDSPPAENRDPDSPNDLTKHSWKYVVRKTAREFSKDQCTDLAAALTYYAVLALFPAMVAVFSLVGLVGQGQQTAKTVIKVMSNVGISSN